jgi:hypothetical protein
MTVVEHAVSYLDQPNDYGILRKDTKRFFGRTPDGNLLTLRNYYECPDCEDSWWDDWDGSPSLECGCGYEHEPYSSDTLVHCFQCGHYQLMEELPLEKPLETLCYKCGAQMHEVQEIYQMIREGRGTFVNPDP